MLPNSPHATSSPTRRLNTAERRLVVNAGSVLESDDQCGCAHLAEQRIFEGTKHFPGAIVIDFV